jgi:DNA-dependent RNA polymerase auxiliary subunit epsilon
LVHGFSYITFIFHETPFSYTFQAFCPVLRLDISSLKKANLKNARLKNASLLGADLTEADLSGADIENTNFCDHDPYHDDCRTKITVDQILKAKNWDKAHYSPEFEKKLQLYLFSELKIAEFLRLTLSENSFSIYFINLLTGECEVLCQTF